LGINAEGWISPSPVRHEIVISVEHLICSNYREPRIRRMFWGKIVPPSN
jgi:hypothetical protein